MAVQSGGPAKDERDPDVSAYLINGDQLVQTWVIKRSLLVKESRLPQAALLHESGESRDDQIKLHDDDAEVLEKLMGYMKEDSVSFFSGGRSHDLHHLEYMRLYMLAEKYGFPVLVYIIADELHRLATDTIAFHREHYTPITSIYTGIYPGQFYRTFAEAWIVFGEADPFAAWMKEEVNANPALAVYLATRFRPEGRVTRNFRQNVARASSRR